MYSIVNGIIRISVRDLVEFICASGDIDNRRSSKADKDAMQEGSRIHRKIQRQMGAEYTPEVFLKTEISFDNYGISIEGRADGVIDNNKGITIDEIKAVYANVSTFTDAKYVHKAQAMCYAYMYLINNDLDAINVQITYCEIETDIIKRFHYTFKRAKLIEWFDEMIQKFKRWSDYLYEHTMKRTKSIKNTEFPFEYREGQRDLVVSVYRSIQRKKKLFIQAPTGVGKTISVIFPAIKAQGEGLADKVFYLTAKTITRTVAKETYRHLLDKGLEYKIAIITAKEKICPCERMQCNPIDCPYAKGHFDRVNDAVYDIITNEDVVDRDIVIEYAKKHNVCPFEMGLDVTYWVDGIIGDYNYAFDPNVHLKRYFSDGAKGNNILLVDEAHNLVERARNMYSAKVCKEDFLLIKNLVANIDKKLAKALERCNKLLLEYKRECEEYMVLDNITPFVFALLKVFDLLSKFDEEHKDFEHKELMSEFYFSVRHFLNMYDLLDDNYVIYCRPNDDKFELNLYCINTAYNLSQYTDKAVSTIFFSATLLPINYYKKLLTIHEDDYAIYAKSVFKQEQRLIAIASDVTSRYTHRNRNEFLKICDYIESVVEAKQGNYMVFFPSYRYMQDVLSLFWEKDIDFEIVCQNNNMNETDREEFLNQFNNTSKRSVVGFCVMGGIFSEGIDLKGESLIGVVVVGTGLPQISVEQQILKNFYDEECDMGFEYAYVYPGMNKVLQAAGRVIRTTNDTGVILLLDDRFLTSRYEALFPREWNDYKTVRQVNIKNTLLNFWESC
ncbi:MAG: PD-(D/E)XK nuclease family protein [Lachnospiraceae bacterium]|nr:PD-(D/E)XK nuclease family protein [Lachnospiraceae bacterium]